MVEQKSGDPRANIDGSGSRESGRIRLRVEGPKSGQILSRLETDKYSLYEDISLQISKADPVLSVFIGRNVSFDDDPFLFSLGAEVAWSVCHRSTIPPRPPISYSSWKRLEERIPTDEASRQFFQENFEQEAELFSFFDDARRALGIDFKPDNPQIRAFLNGYFKYLCLLILELNSEEVK